MWKRRSASAFSYSYLRERASNLIIEDVPVIYCHHCGERYMTAQTLEQIEGIKDSTKSLAPVAVFK